MTTFNVTKAPDESRYLILDGTTREILCDNLIGSRVANHTFAELRRKSPDRNLVLAQISTTSKDEAAQEAFWASDPDWGTYNG